MMSLTNDDSGEAQHFHVAIFCKAPVAGRTKTRLIPDFGADGANRIYVQLAERTLATVRATCERYGASATLWVADDATNETVLRWSREFHFPIHEQVNADLGARMLHCLTTMCPSHPRVLLIGADCPAFTPEHLQRAANALTASSQWVFCPAEDGGYVLVGSSTPSEAPLSGIAWSTSEVMAQTRSALTTAQLNWTETDTLWDVDTAADVVRAELNSFLAKPPFLRG